MSVIYIGHCDKGCIPDSPKSFLSRFHNVAGNTALKNRLSFRDDDRSTWRRFKEVKQGTFSVDSIHDFLNTAGFMPRKRQLPIFDYVTQSATRLFQEYIRTMEGHDDIMPDGIVGQKTFMHMLRWKAEGRCSSWATGKDHSSEYATWMKALNQTKDFYTEERPEILKQIDRYQGHTDTRKLDDWTFDTNEIHLIGIRSGENWSRHKRENNDIFVLLINGMVFKFWGSTDPSAVMASRDDEAFLVEGQHKYRFSWHKVTDSRKIYRALRPYQAGVLVFRDRDSDNALTVDDVHKGLDKKPILPLIFIGQESVSTIGRQAVR